MAIPPRGWHFVLTDEEAFVDYLANKVIGKKIPWEGVPLVDLYEASEPWEIFRNNIRHHDDDDDDDDDDDQHNNNNNNNNHPWVPFHNIQVTSDKKTGGSKKESSVYVFTNLKEASPKRFVRTAGCGTWHGETGEVSFNYRSSEQDGLLVQGCKKTYCFAITDLDRATAAAEGDLKKKTKGHWIMHEYSLSALGEGNNLIKTDQLVLCHIKLDDSKSVKITPTKVQRNIVPKKKNKNEINVSSKRSFVIVDGSTTTTSCTTTYNIYGHDAPPAQTNKKKVKCVHDQDHDQLVVRGQPAADQSLVLITNNDVLVHHDHDDPAVVVLEEEDGRGDLMMMSFAADLESQLLPGHDDQDINITGTDQSLALMNNIDVVNEHLLHHVDTTADHPVRPVLVAEARGREHDDDHMMMFNLDDFDISRPEAVDLQDIHSSTTPVLVWDDYLDEPHDLVAAAPEAAGHDGEQMMFNLDDLDFPGPVPVLHDIHSTTTPVPVWDDYYISLSEFFDDDPQMMII